MVEEICGFKRLEKATGIKYDKLKRNIALFGFPRPVNVPEMYKGVGGKVPRYIWDRSEVEKWLQEKGLR